MWLTRFPGNKDCHRVGLRLDACPEGHGSRNVFGQYGLAFLQGLLLIHN